MNVEEILTRYPEHVQELGISAINLLVSGLPNVTLYPDHKAGLIGFGYSHTYVDQVCTLIFSKKGIKIGFNRGTELPDPHGILEGTGKVHKYVQVNSLDDLESQPLKDLIQQGYEGWGKRKM